MFRFIDPDGPQAPPDLRYDPDDPVAFWRRLWGQEPRPGAAGLTVIIDDSRPDQYLVEIEFHEDWIARHPITRERGRWIPTGDVTFLPAGDGVVSEPTGRVRRDGERSIEPHRHRIHELLEAAFALDGELHEANMSSGDWHASVAVGGGIEGPRSRRGASNEADIDEINRLCNEEGLNDREIAARLDIHPQTVANIRNQRRRRMPRRRPPS